MTRLALMAFGALAWAAGDALGRYATALGVVEAYDELPDAIVLHADFRKD